MKMNAHLSTTRIITAGLMVAAALALSGCGAGMLVGAGATAGVAVAQERSVGDAVDDAGIELQISEALLKDSEVLFRKVDVEALEGRVLLTGNVSVADDRVKVARIAWKVEGVKEVLNELQITNRGSIVDYLKDGKIDGAISINNPRDVRFAKRLMQAGKQVSAEDLANPDIKLQALLKG